MKLRDLFFNTVPGVIGIGDDSLTSLGAIDGSRALTVSAFFQGVNRIADGIGVLPFKVYRDKEVQRRNNIHYLLKEKPNSFQTAFEFFQTMAFIMLTKGNAFAKIVRDEGGNETELKIILYNTVEAKVLNDKLYFVFDGIKDDPVINSDLIHFKNIGSGFLGIDPVSNFRKNLEINLNAIEYTNKVYTGEASSIRGTIEYEKALKDDQKARLRKELTTHFSGTNGKRILFLEDGMKLNQISLDPSQTKFLESRTFEKSEIASMLNVPPFIVGDYSAKYSGNELQDIHFYKQTLLPIITKIEAELKHKLFTKDQILDGYYVKASAEAILRGDSKSRAEFYKELFYLGSISREEIREKEDLPEEINGTAFIHSNLIPADVSREFWEAKVLKDNAKAELDNKKSKENE